MSEKLGKAVLELRTDSKTFDKGLDAAHGKTKTLFQTMVSSQLAVAALRAAWNGLKTVIKDSTEKFIVQEQAEKQVEAVLRSTKDAIGLTKEELLKMAKGFQDVTTYGDEAVLSAQNILLTFTKIGKDVFPGATEIVLDMSQALGQDLKSSAIQVGKALQDPILGVTALRRVGVNFSESQQEVIKNLVETGHEAEAQAMILQELQTEFGGSASAARDTFGGALKSLKNTLGDLQEVFGKTIAKAMKPLIDEFTKVIKFMSENEEIFESLGEAVEAVMDILLELLPVLFDLLDALMPIINGVADLAVTVIQALRPAFDALINIIEILAPILEKVFLVVGELAEILGGLFAEGLNIVADILTELSPLINLVLDIIIALMPIVKTLAQIFGAVLGPAIELMMLPLRGLIEILKAVGIVSEESAAKVKSSYQEATHDIEGFYNITDEMSGASYRKEKERRERNAEEWRRKRQQQNEENKKLLQEFADLRKSDMELEIEEIEAKAEAYRKAGANKVGVQEWQEEEIDRIKEDYKQRDEQRHQESLAAYRQWANMVAQAVGNSFAAMGEAMAKGEDAWGAFAKAGIMAIADVLTAIGQLCIVQAVKSFAEGIWPPNPVAIAAGFAWLGGAAAANLAAGLVKGWANQMAEGGIVTGPTFAQIGEAGTEAVIPLSNRRKVQEFFGDIAVDGGKSVNIDNISVVISFPNANIEDLDQGTIERIFRQKFIPALKDSIQSGLMMREII